MIESKIKYGARTKWPVGVIGQSICSYENKFVFATGGMHGDSDLFRDAVRLDLVSCEWVREPGMNYGR